MKKGLKKGVDKGLDLSTNIIIKLGKKTPVEDIAAKFNTTVQTVDKIRAALKQIAA